MTTFAAVIDKLKTMSLWHLVWISILASELLAEAIVIMMSLALHGEIRPDYLLTGAVTDFVTALVVVSIIVLLVSRLQEADRRLLHKNTSLAEVERIASVGSWSLDLVSNKLDWSDEVYNIFEIDPDEFGASYESFLAAVHPEDREMVDREFTNSVKYKSPYDITHRLLMKDGRVKYVAERCKTFYDNRGKPVRAVGTVQDITKLKLADSSLRKSEERLSSILDKTPTVVFIKDTEGKYLLVNKRYEELFHITNREIIGKIDHDIFPADMADKFRENDLEVIKADKPMEIEELLPQDDGIHTYISVKFPLYDDAGKTYAVCGIATDITQRKQAEERLYQEILEKKETEYNLMDKERNLEKAQEIAHLGHWKLDPKTGKVEGSKELYKIFDLPPDAMTLEAFADVVHPDDRDYDLGKIRRGMDHGEPWNIEHRLLMKDGSVKWVKAIGEPILDDAGKSIRIVGTVQDITQLKLVDSSLRKNEERLELAQRIAQLGSWSVDMESKRGKWSDEMYRIYGLDKSETTPGYEMFIESVHPDDREKVSSSYERILESGDGVKLEHRITRPGGETRFLLTSIEAEKDEKGEVTGLVGVSQDITESKLLTHDLQEWKNRYEAAIKSSGQVLYDWDTRTSEVTYGGELTEILGYASEEMKGGLARWRQLIHKEDLDIYDEALDRIISTRESSHIEYRVRRKDGKYIQVEDNGQFIQDSGNEQLRMIGFVKDITERKKNEEKIRMAAEVYDNATEGVIVTNPEGVIQFVNPAFSVITGFGMDEAVGKTPSILKSGRHNKEFYRKMWKTLLTTGRWQGEVWNRRKNGEAYLQQMTVTAIKDTNGAVTQYASVFSDITEIKAIAKEVEYQAYQDALTGLPNRQLFVDRLKQTIGRSRRDKRTFALLFIDLDDFKRINDSLGHVVGDLMLQGVTVRLVGCAREEDTVARLGGDEFTIILENLGHEEMATIVAQRIISSLEEPFSYKGDDIFATVSIGVAIYPDDGTSAENLLRNADMAMYHAKQSGKNKYHFFTQSMNDKVVKRLKVETSIRKGISNDEFVPFYQPKVNALTGVIAGFEALARWRRPDGSFTPPVEFIPTAEDTGLIVPIGERILLSAMEQTGVWHKSGHPHINVSVNISTVQIDQENLVEVVRANLETTGFPAEHLVLEITETSLMKEPAMVLSTLNNLRDMGVGISLDDFGTGFSSLSHLQKFPIDELKIDRFFVCSIPGNPDDSAIATSIISMAHHLNLRVVAEGVETRDQLDFLVSAGCDETQGYLHSPPLPKEKIGEMLNNQPDNRIK